MTSNIDVTNRALAQIGTKSQITSMTDGSAEALYANLLYNPLRDFMLREGDHDFSLASISLVATTPPSLPWVYAYTYPVNGLRIRSLVPTVYDPLDPKSVEYNVGSNGSLRIILTRVSVALAIYTYTAPEDVWDAVFMEAFTRLLASALAFALENRIEASKEKLSEALNFAGIADMRDS